MILTRSHERTTDLSDLISEVSDWEDANCIGHDPFDESS
jgi:hypothetical protein